MTPPDQRADLPVPASSTPAKPPTGSPNDPAPKALGAFSAQLRRAVILLGILAIAGLAVRTWWKCNRSDGIAFLTSHPGAEWILFPRELAMGMHDIVPTVTEFRRSVVLDQAPPSALATVRAFGIGVVLINGRTACQAGGANWKMPSSQDVAGLLHAGTNEISVWITNSSGPPAAWLRLDIGGKEEGTDGSWLASSGGGAPRPARLATAPLDIGPGNPMHGGERSVESLQRTWPKLMFAAAAAAALVLGLQRLTRRATSSPVAPAGWLSPPTALRRAHVSFPLLALLAVILVIRGALFIHNLPLVPPGTGFDGEGHADYIRFIQQRHALPQTKDGWEMHQPPLYYALGAGVLGLTGRSLNEPSGWNAVAAVNGVAGLLTCCLALLCLGRLFPGDAQTQAAGLLVTSFLPPSLYLMQYVTNEPLTGLFGAATLYCILWALESDSIWAWLGAGAAAGAGLLTKFTPIVVLPVLLVGVILNLVARKRLSLRSVFRSLGVFGLASFLVCGWHYARAWSLYQPPAGTSLLKRLATFWGQDPQFANWVDPGFATARFYWDFGHVLVSPWLGGVRSFPDGLYSTLWGDGAFSAQRVALRPPWNYDLMTMSYLLALPLTLLFLAGFSVVLYRFCRGLTAQWFVVLGSVAALLLGILEFTLPSPAHSTAKAFYAYTGFVALGLLIAAGWQRLTHMHRALRASLWVLLLVWAFTVVGAFWIRPANPQVHLVRGAYLASTRQPEQAARALSRALELSVPVTPGKLTEASAMVQGEAYFQHASLASAAGDLDMAVRSCREAIRLTPSNSEAHDLLGQLLSRQGLQSAALAEFQDAVRLYPDKPEHQHNLGVAYAVSGQVSEAIAHYREAISAKPQYAKAHISLGMALAMRGLLDDAINEFRQALQFEPGNSAAENYLKLALAQKASSPSVSH